MFSLGQSFCKINDKFTKINSVLWAVCLKVLVSLTFSKGLTGYLLHTAEWICGLWQARTRWQIAKIMILLSGLHTRTYKLEECYRYLICSVNKIISFGFLTFFCPLHLPYGRHYNPRFVYFKPTFWRSKAFFQGAFFVKFWPYVRLVFKSGLKSRTGYDGARTVNQYETDP